MAHLNWHGKIVRVWKNKQSETRYHLTETGWILRTTGPRLGGAKVIAKPKDDKASLFHRLSNSDVFESQLIYEVNQNEM